MKKKLRLVLLVDDDNDCNFFHERLLLKMECVEKVYSAIAGKEALDFLTTPIEGAYPVPDIIFLDINMPGMNGWDFLKEYSKLKNEQKAHIVLIMLTTSLNPDDLKRALQYDDIKGFYNKFLDKESVYKILRENFPDSFNYNRDSE